MCIGAKTFNNARCIIAQKTNFKDRCNLRNNIDLEDLFCLVTDFRLTEYYYWELVSIVADCNCVQVVENSLYINKELIEEFVGLTL